MPKLVLDSILRILERTILTDYKSGDRFLTVQKIATKFNVSYVTAFRAMRILTERGLLRSRQGSGIFVAANRISQGCAKRKIIVLSAVSESGFCSGFLRGIEEMALPEDIAVQLVVNDYSEVRSVLFGDYIANLGGDGVIALSFADSALGFYRAMVKGVDIVADIIYQELPILPAVQTDNYRHGADAAVIVAGKGYRKALLLSQSNDPHTLRGFFYQRIQGFCEKANAMGISTQVICLGQPDFMDNMNAYFSPFTPDKAVFSVDQTCNHFIADSFFKRGIAIANDNLIVYDGQSVFYLRKKLPPVTTVGPSLRDLGRGLANKLIEKWKSGSFIEPLCVKI